MAFYEIKFQMHQCHTKPINIISDFTCFYDTLCLTSKVIRKDTLYQKKKEVEALLLKRIYQKKYDLK